MRRVTCEELAADPVGHYVAGTSFAHFCATPRLWGVMLWGQPTMDDARELGRSLLVELAPPAVAHVSIVDARHLAGVDPLAFRAADTYLRANAAALSKWVHRLAMVRPPGLSGAVIAGAYDVVTRPYPVEVFDSVGDALAWLACDVPAADGARMLEAIRAEATGVPHELGRLRAVLDGRLEGASLATAAKRLGVSARSLQRKLAEAHTTFKHELGEARVRVAKRLLVETDRALTEIALEVGCPSLQSFSVLFRRHAGEPPSAYRERLARGVERLARQ